MECKTRITFSEPFVSHRRKVLSGFTLGLVASLLFLTLLFFNSSFKFPKLQLSLQRSQSNPNSSWHFPLSSLSSSSSNNSITPLNTIHEKPQSIKTREVNVSNEGFNNTHLGNLTENGKDRNGVDKVGNLFIGKNEVNVSNEGFEKTHLGNFSENALDHDGVDKVGNLFIGKSVIDGIGNSSGSVVEGESEKRNEKVGVFDYEKCDIFDGNWVKDDSKPYYPLGSCPFVDRDFDCHLNGRPDNDYVKWKWKPNGCDIPSFNATDFLEKLRGQRLVFVGDSLNRNMWESMVCILRQSIKDKKRVYEISGKHEFKKKGVYAFRFEDYNCSVDFVSSPFIVQESTFKGVNGTFETLRLDLMDKTTTTYHDADIIVFNTGHWWTHEKTSKGEDYYQEGNHLYPRLKVLDAYRRALTTWSRWIDNNIDPNRTHVFFRGYSVTHFRGGQWNSGGQCHKETEPIYKGAHLRKYPSKMRVLDYIIPKMKTPIIYMNISRMTDYRKDGHPSIYRMEYKTEAERTTAEQHQDCSHWCLPGVPDTWNELLYASLLKYGKGHWKS